MHIYELAHRAVNLLAENLKAISPVSESPDAQLRSVGFLDVVGFPDSVMAEDPQLVAAELARRILSACVLQKPTHWADLDLPAGVHDCFIVYATDQYGNGPSIRVIEVFDTTTGEYRRRFDVGFYL